MPTRGASINKEHVVPACAYHILVVDSIIYLKRCYIRTITMKDSTCHLEPNTHFALAKDKKNLFLLPLEILSYLHPLLTVAQP